VFPVFRNSQNKDGSMQDTPSYASDSIDRLALAVVLQAVRDVQDRNDGQDKQDARAWLLGGGLAWLDTFDLPVPENFAGWVQAGCPVDNKRLRGLRASPIRRAG
jgi:hypothetical protein